MFKITDNILKYDELRRDYDKINDDYLNTEIYKNSVLTKGQSDAAFAEIKKFHNDLIIMNNSIIKSVQIAGQINDRLKMIEEKFNSAESLEELDDANNSFINLQNYLNKFNRQNFSLKKQIEGDKLKNKEAALLNDYVNKKRLSKDANEKKEELFKEVNVKLNEKLEEIKNIEKELSQDFLEKYNDISNDKKIRITQIGNDGYCNACGRFIKNDLIEEFKEDDDMSTCPSCGRFIYYVEKK